MMKKGKGGGGEREEERPEGADEQDMEWLRGNGAASAMYGLEKKLGEGKGKRSVKWGDDDIKELRSDDDASGGGGWGGSGDGARERGAGGTEEWDDEGASTAGFGGKLSKKEQYRMAVEEAKVQMQVGLGT